MGVSAFPSAKCRAVCKVIRKADKDRMAKARQQQREKSESVTAEKAEDGETNRTVEPP